jgi:hypothetical protein
MCSAWMRRGAVLAGLMWMLAPPSASAGSEVDGSIWSRVNTAALDARRGGVIAQSATTRAKLAGNGVGDGAVTGGVAVSGSFSGSRGIASNIVNTGNNVSIQSTLHVVIELH